MCEILYLNCVIMCICKQSFIALKQSLGYEHYNMCYYIPINDTTFKLSVSGHLIQKASSTN